jgi:hypothetical protein
MLAKLWAIVEAIKVFGWTAKKVDEYIIKPLIQMYRNYQYTKIDKHYDLKNKRREELKKQIDSAVTSGSLEDGDAKLRDLMSKLHNLGDKHDGNN